MVRTTLSAASALLVMWGLTGPVGAAGTEAPMHCSTYTVGADIHTDCSPSPSASPGAAVRCTNYTVGTDTHAECSPVPTTQLAPPRGRLASPPRAAAPRCYTYQIGSSNYTECR